MRKLWFLILVAGCGFTTAASGERREGGCPDDEICSGATPHGLVFYGDLFGDLDLGSFQAIAPTAVGGTQRIDVYEPAFSGPSQPFDRPFDAQVTDPIWLVFAREGETVFVAAGGDRPTLLRIVVPGTQLLYDRIELTAEPVTRVALVPAELRWQPDLPWVMWREGRTRMVVRMHGTTERVVDESLSARIAGATSERVWWDTFELSDVTGDSIGVTVIQAETPWALDVPVVDAADIVVARPTDQPIAGTEERLCFAAYSAERFVAGATLEVEMPEELETIGIDAQERCVRYVAPAAGTYVITAFVAGVAGRFTIDVVE